MALPVSRLISVEVNLSPLAAAQRSFSVLMVLGDSNVINGVERFRAYGSLEEVAIDFGTSASEYKAANLYFAQTPQPSTIMIGRWLRTASAGFNLGGILTPTQQMISNWTSITTGSFKITIDGVLKTLTGLDFSGASNLNGVATIITTALSTSGVCTWNGSSFQVISATTGVMSLVTAAIPAGSGTDISAQLKLTAGALLELVPGFAAEQPVDAVLALADLTTAWYGLMFAASVMPTTDQSLAVSDAIEALNIKRIYGVTTQDTATLSSASSTDLAAEMKAADYLRSFIQYSSSSPYAIASFFGRAFTVNFNGQNTVINLMYKQEPLVDAEDLSTSQANVLQDKRCNVFVQYVNDTAIIQYGVMSGPAYFDEINDTDWLQDAVQTACYNLLFTSPTKIPQTDAGVNQLVNTIGQVCDQAVNNGLVAAGVWTSPLEFGTLKTGDYLKSGFYIFAQPLALQSQADREARKAPPIQVAIKLAGAIDTVDVAINVNR